MKISEDQWLEWKPLMEKLKTEKLKTEKVSEIQPSKSNKPRIARIDANEGEKRRVAAFRFAKIREIRGLKITETTDGQ